MEVRSLIPYCVCWRCHHWVFSAYVGLAFMVALLPVPGYIAKLVQDAQRARMMEVCYLSILHVNLNFLYFRLMHGFKT